MCVKRERETETEIGYQPGSQNYLNKKFIEETVYNRVCRVKEIR